jgi:hypothetical protein
LSFSNDKSAKIFIVSHWGQVGLAIVRKLRHLGFTSLVLCTHVELDLSCQSDVDAFFAAKKPQFVILAVAMVGGIHANMTYLDRCQTKATPKSTRGGGPPNGVPATPVILGFYYYILNVGLLVILV